MTKNVSLNNVFADLAKYEKNLMMATVAGVSKVMDKIGIDASKTMLQADTYSIKTQSKRKTFPKNPSNYLRVRTGDLKRSLLTARSKGSIRQIKIDGANMRVIAIYGSAVNNKGFYYANFHEHETRFKGYLARALKNNNLSYIRLIINEMNKVAK